MNKTLFTLLLLIFSTAVNARPGAGPFSGIDNDPCNGVIRQIAGVIELSSNRAYTPSGAVLLSATIDERTYEIRFSNLVGKYEVILDNDRSSQCFLIQQKYIFN